MYITSVGDGGVPMGNLSPGRGATPDGSHVVLDVPRSANFPKGFVVRGPHAGRVKIIPKYLDQLSSPGEDAMPLPESLELRLLGRPVLGFNGPTLGVGEGMGMGWLSFLLLVAVLVTLLSQAGRSFARNHLG